MYHPGRPVSRWNVDPAVPGDTQVTLRASSEHQSNLPTFARLGPPIKGLVFVVRYCCPRTIFQKA